ncbi:hypothetical protein BWK63_12990 [Flavobacterium covae]|uniref:DUF3164 family protein n=1 Tax=Flavobacterium covae TaxID=2906076 RepID=A0ABW8PKW9_9FLAO|nr:MULTISPECIES: DUF3164 family protein [Flavobacterium]OWP80059.1 hypothetical protein BWK63_12990 [Flavobacterium covae]POR20658.1 hypothetical protein BWK57_12780 [Flavobacterium columnare]
MNNTPKRSAAELRKELEEAEIFERKEAETKRLNYESIKNATVSELCNKALQLSKSIASFKKESFDEMNALHEILKDYSQRHANGLGNFRVKYGNFRVNYKKQGRPTFDEKSTEAEGFIKDFVTSKFENDNDVKDLIISLLERKNGEFDINLIQKLYKMEDRFDDENWKKGIKLMKESYSYEFSKDYVTFEQKGKSGKWEQVPLSFSNI